VMLSFPSISVQRQPPRNLIPTDASLFAEETVRHFAETCLHRLSGVHVSSTGYLSRSWRPIPQGFAEIPSGMRGARILARGVWQSATSSRSPAVARGLFVTDESSNGFFHWVCDVLPRLEALLAHEKEELVSRCLIVPAMAMFPYVHESLLPYPVDGMKTVDPRERVPCDDLLVVPPLAPTGNYRPKYLELLRKRMRSFFSVPPSGRRIFISRAQAPRRRIANEKDLGPVLRNHGFEQVVLEDLSFSEQVRLAGSASVLAGSHGAGLTNMCWLTAGSRVLELRRRGDAANNCYFSLASALDLPYWYLQCDAVRPASDAHVGDLLADPRALGRVLTDMLKD
jgi:capsular polysaccharide biosynthesis protein